MPINHAVFLTPAARAEVIEAQEWYEKEARGLGQDFRDAVDAVIERIGSNPLQFPVVYKDVRRALMRRFPYMLFFVAGGEEAVVIACFHASRDPLHWPGRA